MDVFFIVLVLPLKIIWDFVEITGAADKVKLSALAGYFDSDLA